MLNRLINFISSFTPVQNGEIENTTTNPNEPESTQSERCDKIMKNTTIARSTNDDSTQFEQCKEILGKIRQSDRELTETFDKLLEQFDTKEESENRINEFKLSFEKYKEEHFRK